MTWKEWEIEFVNALHTLPIKERAQIAEYYQEIYGDKLESGLTEEAILAEFGDPQACAQKILTENLEKNDEPLPQKPEVQPVQKQRSIATKVGMVFGTGFLSLIITLPLVAVAFSLVTAFGACSLSFAVSAICGPIYSALAVCIGDFSASGTVCHVGAGLCCCGVSALLAVGFFFATKYTALGSWKALKFFYKGRKK